MDENYDIQYDENCNEHGGILQGSADDSNDKTDVDHVVLGLDNLNHKSKSVLLALFNKTK